MWDINGDKGTYVGRKQHWSFQDEGDILDWEEGNDGKGVIARDGHVHTWNTDDYEVHDHYFRAHPEVVPMKEIWIQPDGRCSGSYGLGLDEQDADLLRDADPRLYVVLAEENTVNFG